MSTKALEFIDLIFTSISEDSSIPTEVKPYLMGLQIPVIKASEDETFFTEATHPARITILLLTSISSTKKDLKNLSISISSVTDKLIHAEDVTTKDFINANTILLGLIDEKEKNNVIKEYEGKIKTRDLKKEKNKIRQLVVTELQTIISDNRIPRTAHDLVLKVWPQFMIQKSIENGVNSPYWKESMNMFKQLVRCLQPIADKKEFEFIVNSYKNLIRASYTMLSDSDISKNRVATAIKGLQSAIERSLELYKQGKQSSDSSSTGTLKNKAVNTLRERLLQVPPAIKVGEWYDLYTEENSAANRLKLSVIIKETGTLIFVDHKGIKGMEKNIDRFTHELARQLSKPVKSPSRFKDTWNEIISKIPSFGR